MSVPVAVRFDEELNDFLAKTVKENNTTKTDFIRQAVIEKLEDVLCGYFQMTGVYNKKSYKTKLQILNQKYNKNIYDMIFDKKRGYFYVEYYNMLEEHKLLNYIPDIKSYIRYHNDELYKTVEEFVL